MREHYSSWLRAAAVSAAMFAATAPAMAGSAAEADRLNARVLQLFRDGKYSEAVPLAERTLAIRERALGPRHEKVGQSLNNLASVYQAQGRASRAIPLLQRALKIAEASFGPESAVAGLAVHNLAGAYRDDGRWAEAEPLFKRGLAIREAIFGAWNPGVESSLSALGLLYRDQGRLGDAETALRRALEISERDPGSRGEDTAKRLNNLGLVYQDRKRLDDALRLFMRALAIQEAELGQDHPELATTLNNIGTILHDLDRYGEAEAYYKLAHESWRKMVGPSHPLVGTALNNLAGVYSRQGRLKEAEAALRQSHEIARTVNGPRSERAANALNNLAVLYLRQGRVPEAEQLFEQALSVYEIAVGSEHPAVAALLDNLAMLSLARNEVASAAERWRRATGILQRRSGRGVADAERSSGKGEAERHSPYFHGLIKTMFRLAEREPGTAAARAAATFETAQWAQFSEAATALAQIAARAASGSSSLALLARERQDLVVEWRVKDKLLQSARNETSERRSTDRDTDLSDRLLAIDARLAEIDSRFAADFPNYSALASPMPISLTEAQSLLREDEALLFLVETDGRLKPLPEETLVWVVTRTEMRWLRSDLGAEALSREVAALRCGLDETAWMANDTVCPQLTGARYSEADQLAKRRLPFDVARAHAVYKSLLGEAAVLTKGKQLLIVASGALANFPLGAFVTEAPPHGDRGEALGDVKWLIRDHAMMVLPSVSSLAALRRVRAMPTRKAGRSMLGIGNPTLEGSSKSLVERLRASAAAYRQECGLPLSEDEQKLQLSAGFEVVLFKPLGDRVSGADVRRLAPIPGTSHILCDIAGDPAFSDGKVLLGRAATKRAVKHLSATGELERYRVVHFATHGLLPRPTANGIEPGLVLTPTDGDQEDDSGYLTASEIAGLKLDADAVVLSACNTAAAGDGGGEALSGLARAFIYAQARSLVVSHWEVYEQAAIEIIPGMLKRAQLAGMGMAQAHRQAVLAIVNGQDTRRAHPAYWAPFVIVGEGAAPTRLTSPRRQ